MAIQLRYRSEMCLLARVNPSIKHREDYPSVCEVRVSVGRVSCSAETQNTLFASFEVEPYTFVWQKYCRKHHPPLMNATGSLLGGTRRGGEGGAFPVAPLHLCEVLAPFSG